MSIIDITSQPIKRFGVRKRRTSSNIYLIRLTELCKIDDFTQTLWNSLDGKQNIYQLALSIQNQSTDIINIAEILEKVTRSLIKLDELGYIVLNSDLDENEPYIKYVSTQKNRLKSILQKYYRYDSSLWFENIPPLVQDKIMTRFFRIIYEMYISRETETPLLSEDYFKNELSNQYLLDEPSALDRLSEEFDIHKWHYDLDEYKIIIQYADTVYSGDLDNRL